MVELNKRFGTCLTRRKCFYPCNFFDVNTKWLEYDICSVKDWVAIYNLIHNHPKFKSKIIYESKNCTFRIPNNIESTPSAYPNT